MKILLPIKRVIDPYAKVRPLSDGSGIDTTGVEFAVNPFDEIAVEQGVRLKEADPSVELVVVTIGGPECEQQVRKMLAMGCDRGILVETETPFDAPSVARELKAIVEAEKPDLVLMGKQATDDDCNQAAQMLAAWLDWPQATFASKVEIAGGTATVTRETDSGEETLAFELPGVITTDLRLNEPRYIGMAGIVKARSKPIDRRAPVTSPTQSVRLTSVASPPARAAGRKLGSVSELVSVLKDQGVLA